MTATTEAVLDAEKMLREGVSNIQQRLQELERFQSATESLEEASEKSREFLATIKEAAETLRAGAELLTEGEVKKLHSDLKSQSDRIQTLEKSLNDQMAEQAKVLRNLLLLMAGVGLLQVLTAAFLLFSGR